MIDTLSPEENARTEHSSLNARQSEAPTHHLFRGNLREAYEGLALAAQKVLLARDEGRTGVAELRALEGVLAVVKRLAGPQTHRLKCDPDPFEAVRMGIKTYEVRKFDRDYKAGDTLVLAEYDRRTSKYSGRTLRCYVKQITPPGSYGLPSDVGVLGIAVCEDETDTRVSVVELAR
jgi:hypothetical protein